MRDWDIVDYGSLPVTSPKHSVCFVVQEVTRTTLKESSGYLYGEEVGMMWAWGLK
jgi:hypothetical protein